MKNLKLQLALAAMWGMSAISASGVNPYLPMWEYIPDGEPYVFEDPDNPGKYRVYIYGSHDIEATSYCGRDQVVWSAPVDNLKEWRYDGVIFESKLDANGHPLNEDEKGDILYAPDVALVVNADGSKTYYLYPNDTSEDRNTLVAKANRPDGPFEVCNWSMDNPRRTEGVLGFDPAVFVDDDGRVYGYWGFGEPWGAELDPVTMATVKDGFEPHRTMSGFTEEGVFRFYEASSMRKIKDKYVLIYSRMTQPGEFGLHPTNYTLAYAYSDNPLGPFTYGGTIIDCRGRHIMPDGITISTADPHGNTHGSICEIQGNWWVFYHRQTGTDEFSRQAMVAPVEVSVEEGPGGKVTISEAEYTSLGFDTEGLDPYTIYPAAIASHFTGPDGVKLEFPRHIFSGSRIHSGRIQGNPYEAPADAGLRISPMVNNVNGSMVGYKYYNFDKLQGTAPQQFIAELIPGGVDGTITVWVGDPYQESEQIPLGEIVLKADMPQVLTMCALPLPADVPLRGMLPLYLSFKSSTEGASLCDLYTLRFK